MTDLMDLALETARKKGADYCDIRQGGRRFQVVRTKNGRVEFISTSEQTGFGVRVLKDGAWGFASSNDFCAGEVTRVARTAVAVAEASRGLVRRKASLAPVEPVVAEWEAAPKIDPFEVKIEDKCALLFEAERLMKEAAPVAITQGLLSCFHEEKTLASTEGSLIHQRFTGCGASIVATARSQTDVQTRTYPVQSSGDGVLQGWEYVTDLDLLGNAERVGREAWELTTADQCPSGTLDVILKGSQMAIQIHESCGHAVEYDRAVGMEAGAIGTSYLTPDKKGKVRLPHRQHRR